jgi:subtilisin family serine protease
MAAELVRARRGLVAALLVLLLALPAFGGPTPPAQVLIPRPPVSAASRPRKAVANRLLVGLRSTVRTAHLSALRLATKGQVSKVIAGGRVLVVDLPAGSDPTAVRAQCLSQAGVAFAEPDLMVYPALVPNDPHYAEQYHLPLVRAPEAWDVTTGSPDVLIAVVDTGVDLDHPDLAAKIYTNPGEVPNNGQDDDGNGFQDDVHGWDFENDGPDTNPEPNGADDDNSGEPDDQVSHGTLVSGIAAAIGNDAWGTAGMDWRAKILPVQVFPDDGGSSVSKVIEGIDYAVMMGADIINLSIGGEYAQSFTPAITNAYNAGILVVCAGGNSDREFTDDDATWESPVCNDGPNLATDNHVLAVASTDQNDRRAGFSNFDSSSARHFIDVCAPGQAMFGPGYYDPAFAAFDEYFTSNSGTSFSAPMVSGLAALILAVHPGYGPHHLTEAIRSACDDIDALNPGFAGKLGAGRINAARALGVAVPPLPPRDVQAADTAGDEGGSITVTWLLSLDDGSGARSVVEYIVQRRSGATGNFAEVGRVAAGQTSFVDDNVTDGVDYYYQVAATDGTLTSDAEVVGPAQAANDQPPARPQGVYARDRAGDDGGVIEVGWDAYSAPADFSHFAIYRSSSNFTSVASLTPLVEVDDAQAVLYLDQSTTDGADYYYAVTAVDGFGNQHQDTAAIGPVQSYSNVPVTFGAGLHFFGTPLEPANGDPAAFLGIPADQLHLCRWQADAEEYVYYSAGAALPDVLRLRLGRGFWLLCDAPLTFEPTGTPAPAGDVSLNLGPGWHQLANPYFGPMDFALTTVTYEGTTMDLASADAANIMRRFAWTYEEGSGGYRLLCPGVASCDTVLGVWEGLWVRVEKSCTVTLRRPTASASAALESAASKQSGGWVARLAARAGGSRDLDNLFGVHEGLAGAAALCSPPPVAGGVELYFAEASQPGRRLAGAFSSVAAAELTWKFVVQASAAGEEVEVWCPDLVEIPRAYAVTVEDMAAAREVDLRQAGRYCCTLREGERARSFVLRLTRRAGVLTLSSLVAQATRGGGAQMTFTLSVPAACTVRLMNIAGRPVRLIEQARSRSAGVNTLVWDGRSDDGSRVPNGSYLVTVEAAGADGTKVQALGSLVIQR